MKQPEHFEVVAQRGIFRPVGEVSLDEGIRLVKEGIAYSRELDLPQLLVVTNGLTGFPSPSVSERYFFVREWAAAAGSRVRIAFVARPEMIDPQKFGMTVAANSGVTADVFPTEPEALAWLQATG